MPRRGTHATASGNSSKSSADKVSKPTWCCSLRRRSSPSVVSASVCSTKRYLLGARPPILLSAHSFSEDVVNIEGETVMACNRDVLVVEPVLNRSELCVRFSTIPVNQEMQQFTVEFKDDALRFVFDPIGPGRIA